MGYEGLYISRTCFPDDIWLEETLKRLLFQLLEIPKLDVVLTEASDEAWHFLEDSVNQRRSLVL